MPLTYEQKFIGRRNFMKASAALPAVGVAAWKAHSIGPVKTGIIGTGMEGRILMSNCDPDYVFLTSCCDIRPDNRELGGGILYHPQSKHSKNPKVYSDHREMLREADIEAVIIATPLHTHAPLAIDALNAGKHVFVEKTMAYSEEQCREMSALAERKNLTLQIGHQRFYNPLYWDAYRMLHEGLLGSVYHVRALWHRNLDWNYWQHVWKEATKSQQKRLMKFDPAPYGYKDLQHLVNWRWYEETSHGLWTELCSHQIAITNWLFGSTPTAVYASEGKYKTEADQKDLYRKFEPEFELLVRCNETKLQSFDDYRDTIMHYKHDDRTIGDHAYAIFEYPEGRTVTYSAIQSSSVDNYYEQIMGTRGTVILSNENETYLYWEPGWDEATASEAAEAEKTTQIEVVEEDLSKSAFSAHESAAAVGGGGKADMEPYDPYKWELQGFAHTIRNGAPNLCDGRAGMQAAISCFYAKESAKQKKRLEIPQLVV